jgi:RHS repeat-associated protein
VKKTYVILLFIFIGSVVSFSAYANDWGDVSLGSGTYHFSETDLKIPARSIPMNWERRYRSNRTVKKDRILVFAEPADGPLGFGWMTPWLVRIQGDAFVNEEGRYFYFEKDSNGNYLPDMQTGLTLKKNATGFELLERGGNTRIFGAAGQLTAVKDARGNTATLNYATDGKLASIKDVIGRTIFTFIYNAAGRISSVTDIANRAISYEYDSVGHLIRVKHENDILFKYTYNSNHGITSKSNALNETYTIEYYPVWQDKGVVKRIIDPVGTEKIKAGQQPAGHEVVYTYDFGNKVYYYTNQRGITYKNISDGEGNILYTEEIVDGKVTPVKKVENLGNRTYKTTDALGNSTIEQKDEWGNVIRKVDEEGYEWRFTYNNQNKVLSITDPLGTVTRVEYDSYGNKTKEIVATGTNEEAVTNYTYNQYNELTSMTKESATTAYAYNHAGNVIEIRDPLGNVTNLTFDDIGNMLTTTRPLIGATTYEHYDFRGNPLKVTDVNGNIITYTYDLLGRVKTMTNQADGGMTQYFYVTAGTCSAGTCGSGGGNGKIDYMILPEGNRIDYDYDNAGNLSKVIDSDGNNINYSYDSKGNRVQEDIRDVSGALQKTVSYQYDLLNRMRRILNPDARYAEHSYDPRGNRQTVRNPNGYVTAYFYDPANRLSTIIQPDNVITSYTYDRRNNLTGVTDANGNTTRYEYDKQNRMTKTISPDTGTTIYNYDLNGNVKTKTDAGGVTIHYEYDASNRITRIDYPSDNDTIYTYDNCPNDKGRLCSMTDASGVTNYEYSPKGQISKETKDIEGMTYVTEYGYDKNGNLTSIKYPSGRMINYNYKNDRVTGILNNEQSIATDIAYKPFGGIASIAYGNGLAGTISYDDQYRISVLSIGTDSTILNYSYTYDFNGNITGIDDLIDPTKDKSYTYDALDRLTGATGPWGDLQYSYDGVGNRQTEANGSGTIYSYEGNRLILTEGAKNFVLGYDANGNTVSEGEKQFIYNQNQRLVKVTEDGTTKGDYVYNGNGQRVKKTNQTGTVVFHYDLQGKIISETAIEGNVSVEYIYLNKEPFVKTKSGAIYWYHNDHLGSPIKMTDLTGSVAWDDDFTPFGEPLGGAITMSMVTNKFRFPGQYYDEETDLNYNYFRNYNPVIGRYVEPDPIGLEGGFNLYIYALNNPVTQIDPTGTLTVIVHGKYCGYGAKDPTFQSPGEDCIDEACKKHDICYKGNNIKTIPPFPPGGKRKKCDLDLCWNVYNCVGKNCMRAAIMTYFGCPHIM